MKEHFALSKAQLAYLKGRTTLKNPSTEKNRIMKKAIQAWSVFVPILKSEVVDTDWKISLFKSPTPEEAEKLWNLNNKLFGFEEFLDALLASDDRIAETQKMRLAHLMITKAISYYSWRFEINPLISQEIERFNNVLRLLEESIQSQIYRDDAMKMYLMRKKQPQPPYINRDEFYHALCIHCYNWSGGAYKSEKEAITNLKHDKHCSYNENFERWKNIPDQIERMNYNYLRIFPPVQKS